MTVEMRLRRRSDIKLASVFLAGVLAGGISVTAAILFIFWLR